MPGEKLFFIAGETSGDTRGAELMRSMLERAPDLQFFGAGGVKMQEIAGGNFHNWTDEAVIGLWDVLKKYGYFKKQFDSMLRDIGEIRPSAVVLIDYPGFNLRMAAAVKKQYPGIKVIYYISPQVWAWNRGRIPKMAKIIDLMVCLFPFEKPLYEKSGLKTEFVGHPLVESLGAKKTGIPREENLVGLFPGSRKKEAKKIFPIMLAAAKQIQKARPEIRFEVAAASPTSASIIRTIMQELGYDEKFCPISLHSSTDLMQQATVAMVASGTATLEAAIFRLPHVIVYKVALITWIIGNALVQVDCLGIVNIMANREIVTEFLQDEATPHAIADKLLQLLNQPEAREELIRETDAVVAQLGEPGASERAATVILQELGI